MGAGGGARPRDVPPRALAGERGRATAVVLILTERARRSTNGSKRARQALSAVAASDPTRRDPGRARPRWRSPTGSRPAGGSSCPKRPRSPRRSPRSSARPARSSWSRAVSAARGTNPDPIRRDDPSYPGVRPRRRPESSPPPPAAPLSRTATPPSGRHVRSRGRKSWNMIRSMPMSSNPGSSRAPRRVSRGSSGRGGAPNQARPASGSPNADQRRSRATTASSRGRSACRPSPSASRLRVPPDRPEGLVERRELLRATSGTPRKG